MNIYLTGQTGGIGSAIKEALQEHCVVDVPQKVDWIIFAHGIVDEGDAGRTFSVNTLVPISQTEQLLTDVRRGVIYISSTAGIRGNTKLPIYSASKAALNSYAETMVRKHPELQFYALCPGPTDTKMWRLLDLEGDPQRPEEVAKAVVRIMNGEFIDACVITVRSGIVSV